MRTSIINAIRAATGIVVLVALAGCSTLTLLEGTRRDPATQTITELASGKALETSEAGGERRATVAGQWLANAKEGLSNTLHIAAGGAGRAVLGAVGGAGAGFLVVAMTGGCLDPATCGSLVAGMMTAGAVIGGVIGFVAGARDARLKLSMKTRPQHRSVEPTDQPMFWADPSHTTTSE